MTVSHWQAAGDQPRREVDVLVVGAGLVGGAAAVFAAQSGHEVVITEAADPGSGASGRNAGFMITGPDIAYHRAIERYGHTAVRDLWALSEATHRFWREVAVEAGVPLAETGSLLLAESAAEARDLALAAQAMQADGLPVEYIDRDPLGRGYHAALAQPGDAAVHPYKLVQAVIARSGAEVLSSNAAYAIEQLQPDRVTVHTRRWHFEARYVLLCVNAYASHLHPYFAGKVTPTRAQCLVTEPLAAPVIDTCGYSDYGNMYYRMTFDGRLLLGGARHQHAALEHDTTEDHLCGPVQAALDAYLRRYFPEVDAQIARRWAGIMGFSADGLPLVGTLPGLPRVGFAVGFTGHGLALGAGTAERAVALLLDGIAPGVVDAARPSLAAASTRRPSL